jgi:hypothetical protein
VRYSEEFGRRVWEILLPYEALLPCDKHNRIRHSREGGDPFFVRQKPMDSRLRGNDDRYFGGNDDPYLRRNDDRYLGGNDDPLPSQE